MPKPRIWARTAQVSSRPWGTASTVSSPDSVVINPGVMQDSGRVTVIGEHTDGTHASSSPYRLRTSTIARRPVVRGSGRLPARLRDRLPDAGDEGRAARGRVGARGASAAVSPPLRSRSRRRWGGVIVTSSSDAKLERANELGADATVNHESGDVKATVIEATGGRGADIVIEHVGEATWRTSQDVASRAGGSSSAERRRAQPAGRAAPNLVEGAPILGSSMGTKRTSRAPTSSSRAAGEGRRRLDVPAGRDPRRTRAPRGGPAVREDRLEHSRVGPAPPFASRLSG